jgi:hypothetical protein
VEADAALLEISGLFGLKPHLLAPLLQHLLNELPIRIWIKCSQKFGIRIRRRKKMLKKCTGMRFSKSMRKSLKK